MERLANELCAVFLGWRLREDYAALLAIGEGTLRIDLASGECWCDAEPLPSLFIAGELRARVDQARRADAAVLMSATLEAEFSKRLDWIRGEPHPALDIACRVTLAAKDGSEAAASANNAASR